MAKRHTRAVVVGMSGGVDSSAAAAMLCAQGWDVIGVTIKTYNYEGAGGAPPNETSCCSLEGINDARRVAHALGIPHYVVDLTAPFKEHVIDYFTATYMHGETPNPCVMCNRQIKWAELLRKAAMFGADYIATGHYAALRRDSGSGRHVLSRGRDGGKDQSYALWNVAQEHLARTVFPLAAMTKPQARAAAARAGLDVAAKRESYEICFIPDNDYGRLLREQAPDLAARVAGGAIEYNGARIGAHDGYPFYTIGQRRGLRVSTGAPAYVVNIDAATNTIVLGGEKDLLHAGLAAEQANFIKYPSLEKPMRVTVKIRYKDPGAPATAVQTGDRSFNVFFDSPRRAITPGQSAVLYEGDDVVGGGVIKRWMDGDECPPPVSAAG